MNKNPEYNFNPEIKDKLKGFKIYLQELGNGENTIHQKMNYTGYFIKWLESENLQTKETTYNDLLNFIDYCRLEEKSTRQINSTLRSIKNYFEYLKTNNPELINPASNLQLKGKVNKLPSNIISYTKLEQLYQSFPPVGGQVPQLTPRDKRNKIILGLLIYQGVTTEELKQLETNHIKLKQGKIYVPGNRKRNSRTLELKPCQILELNEYLAQTRPKILKEIDKPKPARKPDTINKERLKEQLFISINGSENIKNSLHHMFRNISKTNPEILSPKQIRASVITYWLKNYNLRQVQYMAGHKHVSSTERYQLNNLDKLQEKIEKLHPLNKAY